MAVIAAPLLFVALKVVSYQPSTDDGPHSAGGALSTTTTAPPAPRPGGPIPCDPDNQTGPQCFPPEFAGQAVLDRVKLPNWACYKESEPDKHGEVDKTYVGVCKTEDKPEQPYDTAAEIGYDTETHDARRAMTELRMQAETSADSARATYRQQANRGLRDQDLRHRCAHPVAGQPGAATGSETSLPASDRSVPGQTGRQTGQFVCPDIARICGFLQCPYPHTPQRSDLDNRIVRDRSPTPAMSTARPRLARSGDSSEPCPRWDSS